MSSYNLKALVNFITDSFRQSWFEIKINDNFTDGHIHVYKDIKNFRYMINNLKYVVGIVIERNASITNNEYLLEAMIFNNAPLSEKCCK